MKGSLEMPRRDPVSQRDIARHFGVSHVTVSLALRRSRRVSQSLAEEIRAYAESVGYRRDPVLYALSAYRGRKSAGAVRGALGWINAWDSPMQLRGLPEMERFWRGAESAAQEQRFRLEEFRLGTDLSPERLHQVLHTRNIRGLILPPHPRTAALRGFPWDDYAVVRFGRALDGPRGHCVLPSISANLLLALRTLRESGHARIGCLTADSLLRRAGYCPRECLSALRRALAPGEVPVLLDLAGVPPAAHAGAVRAWVQAHRLDAILAGDADAAAMARDASGLPVAALSVCGPEAPAGIDPAYEEIGRTAVHLLESLMQERTAATRSHFREVALEGVWVERGER
jgi:DNA-binding LacI/PurR family transcriptional regulator